jgi:hypothetical protein
MKEKSKITIKCGESIELNRFIQKDTHPVTSVKQAISLIEEFIKVERSITSYSNSPDFVSAIKHIGESKGVEVEFFLNDTSQGNDIEGIFADFNRALDLLHDTLKENEIKI